MRGFINIILQEETNFLKSLEAQGFNVNEILYHGSRRELEQLDNDYGRTKHIYLSPDVNTASYYGQHIHICVAKQNPIADLTDESRLLQRISKELREDYPDMDISSAILSGMMWEHDIGGATFQDSVLDTVFDMGFTSIRIIDSSITGTPLSVVFRDGSNIAILDTKLYHDM